MAWRRSRIALIVCGGTALGGTAVLTRTRSQATDLERWRREFSELEMMAEVTVMLQLPTTTNDLTDHWLALVKDIQRTTSDHDGVVILHDPQYAPLTAVALEALIVSSGKPIVVTPGQTDGRAGGRTNLINAIQTATADLSGVVYVVGQHIYSAASLDQGTGEGDVRGVNIGKIDFGVRLFNHHPRSSTQVRIQTALARTLVVLTTGQDAAETELHRAAGVLAVVDAFVPVLDVSLIMRHPRMAQRPRAVVHWPMTTPVPAGWVALRGPLPAARIRFMAALGSGRSWRRRLAPYESPRP